MSRLKKHQQGAVMLVAVLFLLVVVAVMAQTLVTVSGSDVLDSAKTSDAAEALFLAESGIERATWQYVGGTSCAALSPQGPFSFGGGSYSITASNLVSGRCRLTLTGLVGDTSRSIVAEVTTNCGQGWAVGAASGGAATLLCWDGSNWNTSGPWAGVPAAELLSVACADANNCWAVGRPSSGELILRWDGSSWSRQPVSGSIPNVDINGVTCFNANDCWAVGDDSGGALTIHWNGTAWSRVSASSLPNRDLFAVHCAASNDCWAVGQPNGFFSPLLAHWNGVSWAVGPTFFLPGRDFYGLFCVSGSNCHAVGRRSFFRSTLARKLAGSWFSSTPFFGFPKTDFNGVSCSSSNDCWAVGDRSGSEVIAHWNGGNWSRTAYGGVSNRDLYAVHVVSSSEAYTVGQSGIIARWNGSTWANQTSPAAANLNSVFVNSGGGGGGGSASLVSWSETIF